MEFFSGCNDKCEFQVWLRLHHGEVVWKWSFCKCILESLQYMGGKNSESSKEPRQPCPQTRRSSCSLSRYWLCACVRERLWNWGECLVFSRNSHLNLSIREFAHCFVGFFLPVIKICLLNGVDGNWGKICWFPLLIQKSAFICILHFTLYIITHFVENIYHNFDLLKKWIMNISRLI